MGVPRRARPAAVATAAAMALRAPPRLAAPRSVALPLRCGAHGPAPPRPGCPARCGGRRGGRGHRAVGGAILGATGAARAQASFRSERHGVAGALPAAGGGARRSLRPGWVSGAERRFAGGRASRCEAKLTRARVLPCR